MINIFGNFIFWTALSFVILLAFIIVAFTTHRGKRRNYKYIAIMLMLGIYLANVTFISSLIFFGNAVEWKENVSSYNDVSIKDFSKNTNLPEKNSVMGMSIVHVFKVSEDDNKVGKNFHLNINEKFKKCSIGDGANYYLYTDPNGIVHGFRDHYYYIDTKGKKQYVKKEDVTVNSDGTLTKLFGIFRYFFYSARTV